jgi:pimeloyl-ACP methyl ester carboxylesterase
MPILLFASALASLSAGTPGVDGTVPSSDGVPIRYHAEGAGEPALVFVHCWCCDRHLWDAQLPAFAPRHRIVTLDLAGHGESGRGRKDWTIEAYAADVRAVLGRVDASRAILVGHSMGGKVIVEAARSMKSRVVAVVPVDAWTSVGEREKVEDVDAFVAPFQADFKAAATRFVRNYMFVPTTDPRLVERLVDKTAASPADVAVGSLRQSLLYDLGTALREIEVPIHALNSDQHPTRLDAIRRFAPRFEATIMSGVGHYLMLEDPSRFNQLLGEVVAAVVAAEGARKR